MLIYKKLLFLVIMVASTTASALTYQTGQEVKLDHTYGVTTVSKCSDNSNPGSERLIFGDEREAFIKFVESISSVYLKIELKMGKVTIVNADDGSIVKITCTKVAEIK